MKIITDIDRVNSAEAIIGSPIFFGDKMICPFYNLSIMEGFNTKEISIQEFKYIGKSYLYFENVKNFTFDYESSRHFDKKKTQCFGGDVLIKEIDWVEFWIEFERGSLVIPEINDENYSNSMFEISEDVREFILNIELSNKYFFDILFAK